MNSAVKYRDVYLMKSSEAYVLWEAYKKDPKLQKNLDQHLKALTQKETELVNRYKSI